MALPVYDNFNRANENPLSGGGVWHTCPTLNAMRLGSNQVYGSNAGQFNGSYYDDGQSFDDDQYCQAVWGSSTAGEWSICVRQSTSQHTQYYVIVSASYFRFGKVVNGTNTYLTSEISRSTSVGTVVKLEVVGYELRVYFDGVQHGTTATDTAEDIASGYPSLVSYRNNGIYDDFEAGNVSGGGTVPLSGAISASSSAAAALAAIRGVSGNVAASSDVSGGLGIALALQGAISASSNIQAVLEVLRDISGAISAQSGASGHLGLKKQLSGTIDALSDISGDLSLITELLMSGTIAAQSGASAAISVIRGISGAISALSTASAALQNEMGLSGSITPSTQVNGLLAILRGLTGAVTATSDISALMGVRQELQGLIAAVSALEGNLVTDLTRIIVEVERRIFELDTGRRAFVLDTERRHFRLDDERRIFTF
jgi:hypothetical protein